MKISLSERGVCLSAGGLAFIEMSFISNGAAVLDLIGSVLLVSAFLFIPCPGSLKKRYLITV